MKEKLKFQLRVLKSRILSVRIEVTCFAWTALASILLIEVCLKHVPAPSQTFYDFGQVYLKLCYSLFSAYLFFLINMHIPKEIRKVKTYRLVNNHVGWIRQTWHAYIHAIFDNQDESIKVKGLDGLTKKDYVRLCKTIDPTQPVLASIGLGNRIFGDHYEPLEYVTKKINKYISELLLINDLLEADLMMCLTNINDKVTQLSFFVGQKPKQDLSFLSHVLYDVTAEMEDMLDVIFKKYRPKYDFEYHFNAIKHNKIREAKASLKDSQTDSNAI